MSDFAHHPLARRQTTRVRPLATIDPPGSVGRLPPAVRPPYEVYLNGVRQRPGTDYTGEQGALVFARELRKDRIAKWRWFVGAWGVGTYRQDDSVDVRYERPDGTPAVAERLDIVLRP